MRAEQPCDLSILFAAAFCDFVAFLWLLRKLLLYELHFELDQCDIDAAWAVPPMLAAPSAAVAITAVIRLDTIIVPST
jgi:hypothetical protein